MKYIAGKNKAILQKYEKPQEKKPLILVSKEEDKSPIYKILDIHYDEKVGLSFACDDLVFVKRYELFEIDPENKIFVTEIDNILARIEDEEGK